MERLVVEAPDGVLLSVADGAASDGSVERRGPWRVQRSVVSDGRIRWSWTSPLTAWKAGVRTTPALRLRSVSGDTTREEDVAAAAFRAASPLPTEARTLRTAPPDGPWTEGRVGWPPLLVALQALLTVGLGVTWWRTRGGAPQAVVPALRAEPDPPDLRALAARASERPGDALLELVRAVRHHPRVTSCGVGDAHTRPEILERVGLSLDPDGLDALLSLADRVAYGAVRPTTDEVRDVADPVVEALDHA